MAYPKQADLLAADPLLDWLDEHFLRPDPFAFRRPGFRRLLTLVAEEMDIDANGIYCIGSGAVGLSLNPAKIVSARLKQFDGTSDIDLAVISDYYFEVAWRDLRRAAKPSLSEMQADLVRLLDWQRKRFFDGAILAHKALPYLSFGPRWIAARVKISHLASTLLDREIDVNAWLFRDYWSVRNYVSTGIVRCREELISA